MSAFALTREERRLRRVSKDQASWLETAQGRLLTMKDNFHVGAFAAKKKARLTRALATIGYQLSESDQAVLL
jgi:hypothetical protein